MLSIHINDLVIFANHGVFHEEKVLGQKFIVSAQVDCNFSSGVKDDHIDNTLNYAALCQRIEQIMTSQSWDLIESACDAIATGILHTYGSLIKHVHITIKKPWAPVHMSLDTVGVSTTRSWHTVYLGLGSNLGDSTDILNNAIGRLRGIGSCVQLVSTSSYVKTAPVSPIPQPHYLNAAVAIRTTLTPHELIAQTMAIENALGRERTEHWGPRTLDIDILAYDQLVTDDPIVTLPHPLMHERGFVLQPLAEIAPLWVHPLLGQRVQTLLAGLKK